MHGKPGHDADVPGRIGAQNDFHPCIGKRFHHLIEERQAGIELPRL